MGQFLYARMKKPKYHKNWGKKNNMKRLEGVKGSILGAAFAVIVT